MTSPRDDDVHVPALLHARDTRSYPRLDETWDPHAGDAHRLVRILQRTPIDSKRERDAPDALLFNDVVSAGVLNGMQHRPSYLPHPFHAFGRGHELEPRGLRTSGSRKFEDSHQERRKPVRAVLDVQQSVRDEGRQVCLLHSRIECGERFAEHGLVR